MINKFIVIYYLFLFCSVAIGLLGGVVGLVAISRWRSGSSHEIRFELEKKLHLSASAIFIGTVLRLVMLPLWFLMLQSLIPVIPGAMCLGGVHQNVPFYSWLASSMKLVLPLFYFSWILITVVDRKFVTQPFLRYRHIFLLPLVILILGEAFLDVKHLVSIKAVSVTCCTAIFDYNTGNIPEIFTESNWYFVIIFCAAFAIQTLLLLLPDKKATFALSLFNSAVLFFSLPLAIHTKLSPLILEAPFHHCIFCLLQNNVSVLSGSFLLLAAIYLSFSYGLIGFAAIGEKTQQKITSCLGRIKRLTLCVYCVGFILILIPVINHLNLKGGV